MQTIPEMLNTAEQHYQSNQFEQAENIYQQVIQLKPNNPIALHSLGLLEFQKGNVGGAIDYINKALLVEPSYTSAYYNLGIILENQGDLNRAIVQYENAILTYPVYVDAYFSLGRVLEKQDRFNEAMVQYKKAIAINPSHEPSLKALGYISNQQGNLEEAVIFFQKAIAINPLSLDAVHNFGAVLRGQGKLKEAVEAFKYVISHNPSSGMAYFNLVQIEPSLDALKIEKIHQFLEHTNLSETDRLFLHLSLGLVYHKAKSYEKAFFHINTGNAMQRKQVNYNHDNELLLLRSIEEIFNKDYFEERFGTSGIVSESPIFIMGMPRSGTTLVEQIIATHPLVHGGGEMMLLDNLLAKFAKQDSIFPSLAAISPTKIDQIAQDYLEQLHAFSPPKKIVTNKKVNNYLFLGLIALMFPQAKIIHCQRNPLDTCLSCFMTWFHTGQYFTYDLKELGSYYQAYEQLMQHWRQVLPIPMLEVQYEDLIEKQEEISRQIIAYCDLEWDSRCLLFHENTRSVHTASDLQVRQPIYQSSIGKWRHYEKHLAPLKEALGLEV